MTSKSLIVLLLVSSIYVLRPQFAAAQLYEARNGSVSVDGQARDAVQVQTDGSAQWLRDFWQSWLKDTYNIRLKGNGMLGVGKKAVLEAQQVPVSSVSGKLLNFYSTIVAPTDSTAELAVYAAFDKTAYLSASDTPTEYAALRNIAQGFATAARQKAYREQLAAAEEQLRTTEKEKERLSKDVTNLQTNTAANLLKIATLQQQNEANVLQARQDSVKLVRNAQELELYKQRVQRRRDQLSALGRK
ncbi:hypothetical protein MUN82_21150 [Hymenobacter aerilatus]|uniref:DUF4468 domain-containing protein n=1 Tax=Hymenobacter aerilatus TaxID=2932251 RepID=A0A8T9SVK7_9BACT|nr:hypothetical protein [Hymenobacter aerilatus]UOR05421.1 hypothetical protein MUN82_21150 [Hymenobacter aerilatus]